MARKAKLNDDQVLQIRTRATNEAHKMLMAEFGISNATFYKVLKAQGAYNFLSTTPVEVPVEEEYPNGER